ncbi:MULTISPECIES: FAD-dependent oxidoreductase [unclassified Streptomyces]|uniref:FAD-dependent oxidoreductase n=1 Tax=unclassified Streptomyces TaxID=2593676 RepID=UPI0033A256C7
MLFDHFRTGARYPVGGSAAIARAMLEPIRAAGGEVFVRAPVARIELDGTRVTGVVLADGTRVRAPVVISAAGAHHTHRTLLPGPPAASTDSPRTSPPSATAAVPVSRTGCVRAPGSGACASRAGTASPAASSARSPAACSPPTKPSAAPAGPACGRDS